MSLSASGTGSIADTRPGPRSVTVTLAVTDFDHPASLLPVTVITHSRSSGLAGAQLCALGTEHSGV